MGFGQGDAPFFKLAVEHLQRVDPGDVVMIARPALEPEDQG
jgi:hypothetical protein